MRMNMMMGMLIVMGVMINSEYIDKDNDDDKNEENGDEGKYTRTTNSVLSAVRKKPQATL